MARPKEYTEKWIRSEAKALLRYAKEAEIPFEKEFASKRGYSSQRISEFAKSSEEFSEALKKMKDIQEVKLVKAALAGKINVTFTIFTLKNVSGWRDVQPVGVQDSDKMSLLESIKRLCVVSGTENISLKDHKGTLKGYQIL